MYLDFEHQTKSMNKNSDVLVFYRQFSPVIERYQNTAFEIAWKGTHQSGGWTAKLAPSILKEIEGFDLFWLETDWFYDPTEDDPGMIYFDVWKDLYRFRMLYYSHFSVGHTAPDERYCDICGKEKELNKFRDTMVEKRQLERIDKKGPEKAEVNVQEPNSDWLESGSRLDIRGMASKLQANLHPTKHVKDTAASKKRALMAGSLHQTPGFEAQDRKYENHYELVKCWAEYLGLPSHQDCYGCKLEPTDDYFEHCLFQPLRRYSKNCYKPKFQVNLERKRQWKCRRISTTSSLSKVECQRPESKETYLQDWNLNVDDMLDSIVKSLNLDGSPIDGLPEMSASGNDLKEEKEDNQNTDLAEDVEVMVESVMPSEGKLFKVSKKHKLLKMVKRNSGKDKKAEGSNNFTKSVKSVSASPEKPEAKKTLLRTLSKKAKDVLLDGKKEDFRKKMSHFTKRSSDTAAKTESGLSSSIVTKRSGSEILSEKSSPSAFTVGLSELSNHLRTGKDTLEYLRLAAESVSSTAGSEMPLLENAGKHQPEVAGKKKCQKARNWIKDKSRKIKSGLIHREDHESHTAFVLRVVFVLLKIMLKHTLKPVALLVKAAVLKFFAVLSGLN